jgi:hypothetical protein
MYLGVNSFIMVATSGCDRREQARAPRSGRAVGAARSRDRLRLQSVQEINRLAGVRCDGEYGPLVAFQDFELFVDVAGVILATFRCDAQVGIEERGAQFGDQLLKSISLISPPFPAAVTPQS